MAETEGTRQKWAAGATTPAEIRGKLVEHLWWMKKQGYPESTIGPRLNLLRLMAERGANLWDPESVKEVIARQETWGNGRKRNAVYAYNTFATMEGLTWEAPRYEEPDRLPFVPWESELDLLIKGCAKTVSVFLQGLKETGADPGELWRAEWIDVNERAKTVAINRPVKGHNARIVPVSRTFLDRLNLLPKRAERIFTMRQRTLSNNFRVQRRRIARDFNNPRLLKVTFTTFRHWRATYEYHVTRDLVHVQQLLGHRDPKTTMIYIDIEKALYGEGRDADFIDRGTRSTKGARALIRSGFEYVLTTPDGTMLFRKRK